MSLYSINILRVMTFSKIVLAKEDISKGMLKDVRAKFF